MANKYPQEAKKKIEETLSVSSGKTKPTHPAREKRRGSAKKCLEARAKLSDKQQLARLDKLLGKNKGAQKERARLKKSISNE
jgi:hypothetical protein